MNFHPAVLIGELGIRAKGVKIFVHIDSFLPCHHQTGGAVPGDGPWPVSAWCLRSLHFVKNISDLAIQCFRNGPRSDWVGVAGPARFNAKDSFFRKSRHQGEFLAGQSSILPATLITASMIFSATHHAVGKSYRRHLS